MDKQVLVDLILKNMTKAYFEALEDSREFIDQFIVNRIGSDAYSDVQIHVLRILLRKFDAFIEHNKSSNTRYFVNE